MKRSMFLLLTASVLLAGCGYSTESIWRQDVRTIAVPIFENRSLRRGFEFDLTKAVTREIMRRTDYTIADKKDADTVLLGEIIDYRTPVLAEDSADEVFEISTSVTMHLTWQDQRTGNILFEGEVSESGNAVVRTGGNRYTAREQAFNKIAHRIVNRLLSKW